MTMTSNLLKGMRLTSGLAQYLSIMKRLIIIAFFAIHFSAKSQNSTTDCGVVMETLSKEWKRDSTGNNGYRRENTKFLDKCTPNNLDSLILLRFLGKPNRIERTNHGSSFMYYYYDIMTLPKSFDGPLATAGIQFNFTKEGKYLSRSHFDIDR